VGRVLNYLLVPLYTRAFTPSEYGVVTELYAYVSFLVIVLTYGMETAFFNFSKSENDAGKVYHTALLSLLFSSLVFLLLMVCFAGNIASSLQYEGHSDYIVWFAAIIGIDAITAIPFARLRLQEKAKYFAFVKLASIVINIALNVLFIKVFPAFGLYNPQIGVGYIFIANLIASSFTLLLLLPEFKLSLSFFDSGLLNKMLKYALPLLLAGLAGMVNETMDRILLKHLLPQNADKLNELGIYGACYKIAMLMTIFIQAYRFAAEPFFFGRAKEKDAKEVYADVTKYLVIACCIIFLGIMLNIDIVKYFIEERYFPGLKIVPVLLMANMCFGFFVNLSMWYKLSGKTKYGAYLALFGALITLLFLFLLVPKTGYMGAAWATLICYASMMLCSYILSQKYYPVKYDFKKISIYFAATALLFWISITFVNKLSLNLKLPINALLFILFVLLILLSERKSKTTPISPTP